ncbi:unnamed protein product, partial [Urochloa humidicola]
NRLHLKVSIDSVRWLAFQACPFRGHDESASSMNQDIVNAMDDVTTTKKLIQNFREHGWDSLISDVISFCN